MQENEQRYEAYKKLPCGVVILDADDDLKLVYGNEYYSENFSNSDKTRLNINDEDKTRLLREISKLSDGEIISFEYRFSDDCNRRAVAGVTRADNVCTAVLFDATEYYNRIDEAQNEKEKFAMALCNAKSIVMESNLVTGSVKLYIPSGNGSKFEIMSTNSEENPLTIENLHPRDRAFILEKLRDPNEKTLAMRMKLKNDSDWKWYRVDRTFEFDETGKPISMFGIMNDIDNEKKMEKERQRQLELDSELKIYNRNAAVNRINKYLSRQNGTENRFALLVLDVDDFKTINDTYGHLCGDAVIAMVAKTLREIAEGQGIVGRYGGDEFFVFLKDMTHDEITAASDKILQGIKDLLVADERHITCSIGVALGESFSVVPKYKDLFEKADAALYNVKRNGKARWEIYNEDTMSGENGGHAIEYEADDETTDDELLKSRDMMKVFMELSAGAKTADSAVHKIIRYVAEKFSIDWFQVMELNCKEDLVTIKHEWCSDPDFRSNAGRSGYYVHEDLMRFREYFSNNPIFLILPENIQGFSPKFQREFEKNMRYAVVYIANVTTDDVFYMFVCTRFDKDNRWGIEDASELNTATKLMSMYMSQANKETENERRYREMIDYERKTGLYTVAKFYEQLGRLRKIAAENDDDVVIIHTDFNHFIQFNRRFGIAEGDNLLIAYGDTVQGNDDPDSSICTHIDSTDIFLSAKRVSKGDRSFIDKIDKLNKDFCREYNEKYEGADLILKTGICYLGPNVEGGIAVDSAVLAKQKVKDFTESFCVIYEE